MGSTSNKGRLRESESGKVLIKVKYSTADVHEDSYEEGEGKYVQSYDLGLKGRTFDSVKDLLDAIESFMCGGLEPKDFSLMEEEDGSIRVVTDVMQNGDSELPSDAEIESWKNGETILYDAFVDVKVELFEARKLSAEETGHLFDAAGVTSRS